MCDIDYIMNMMDWKRPKQVQEKGIELASHVKSIDVFLQPLNPLYNKNVWENCAIVISKKTDEELKIYLIPLLEWLQDLTWPGALIILDRLKHYNDVVALTNAKKICLERALATTDQIWNDNLSQIFNKNI